MNRTLMTVLAILALAAFLPAQSAPSPTPGNMAEEQRAPGTQQPAAPANPAPPSGQPADPSAPTQANPPNTMPSNGASAAPHQASTSATRRVAPGSVIPARLSKSIDAKKAKQGDEVVASVTQDLSTNAGVLVIPKDTKIIGHVTEAQAHNKEQKESQLGISFDHAVMKNGEQMQLPMSIQAIIAPRNTASNANAEAEPSANYPGPGSSAPAPGGGARPGSMGGSAPQPQQVPQAGGGNPAGSATGAQSQRPPITGNTQGVIGISNLTLSGASNGAQGSVMTSEKNNVKLDDGTLLLLRVNQ